MVLEPALPLTVWPGGSFSLGLSLLIWKRGGWIKWLWGTSRLNTLPPRKHKLLAHLFVSMITEALGTPAPLLNSLLIPISLFKYNLVFTWFMDSVPVTELHSAWAAYWFSITAAQKNKEMTAALGCRPRAGWERQELIISGVITQAVPGRTVTPGAQPATQGLSASDTMSSPDCSAWVLIPASLDTNPFPIQLPHL